MAHKKKGLYFKNKITKAMVKKGIRKQKFCIGRYKESGDYWFGYEDDMWIGDIRFVPKFWPKIEDIPADDFQDLFKIKRSNGKIRTLSPGETIEITSPIILRQKKK